MVAELNGTIGASHVNEKLARLIHYGAVLRACVEAAARGGVAAEAGQILPAPVYTNVGKFHFASQFHAMVAIVQDLAGGLAITAPGEASLRSEETGHWVRKYAQGAVGTDPELRLRVMHLIRDLTASDFGGYNYVVTLHGEGSPQAQLMQTLRDADLQSTLAALADVLDEDVSMRTPLPRSALPLVV
jgi:4-hydroxybutyryl-CoA dehydratase/vinylacetyl-CoA-Delta-isomerase